MRSSDICPYFLFKIIVTQLTTLNVFLTVQFAIVLIQHLIYYIEWPLMVGSFRLVLNINKLQTVYCFIILCGIPTGEIQKNISKLALNKAQSH